MHREQLTFDFKGVRGYFHKCDSFQFLLHNTHITTRFQEFVLCIQIMPLTTGFVQFR